MQQLEKLKLALNLLVVALFLLVVISAVAYFNYDPNAGNTVAIHGDPAKPAGPAAITDPVALKGKGIFENNCSSCHAVTAEVVVGPGLKGINERRPEAWLISWIKNSQKLVQGGDQYAVEVYTKYNKTPMPSFAFSDDDIKAILAYVKASGG